MRSIFLGALWLTAANLFMRLASMVFQVYTSRVLGAAGAGLLQLIFTLGALAMTLGTAGVRVAATCLVAEEYGHGRSGGIRRAVRACLGYGAVVSALAAAGLYLLSEPLAAGWIGDPRAASSLRLYALALPLNCLWAVLAGYFTASNQVRLLVRVQILDRLLSMAITFPLLRFWAGTDLEKACCAIVGGSGLATAASFVTLGLVYLYARPPLDGDAPPVGKRLLRLGLPLAFNEIARSGLSALENLLIPRGLERSGGNRETAMSAYGSIQGMTFPAMMLPAVVLSSLSDLMIPALARAKATSDRAGMERMLRACLRAGLLYALGTMGFYLLCGQSLGQLIYRNAAAGRYLALFAPVLLILYLDAIVDGLLKGLIEQVACMRYNTLTSLLEVGMIWFLVPLYGVDGFFFSFVVAHGLNFFLSIARLLEVTRFSIRWGFVCRAAGAAGFALLLCALATAPLESAGPGLCVLVRGSLFLGLLALGCRLSRLSPRPETP